MKVQKTEGIIINESQILQLGVLAVESSFIFCVQECDATVDAIKNFSPAQKNSLQNLTNA